MKQNFNVKMFDRWLKQNFLQSIVSAPVNSMTPFAVKYTNESEEYIFIVKAESWLYEPLSGKSLSDKVPVGVKAYMEGNSLIFGFDVEPDINLESEITQNKIGKFLTILKQQKTITVVIVDHLTLNIVWLTNDYPFWKVRDQFQPLFEYFKV